MKQKELLNNWWASLTQQEKCRIASKVYHDEITSGKEASRIWILLDNEKQSAIYAHCTDKHGLLLPEWSEGKGMSY